MQLAERPMATPFFLRPLSATLPISREQAAYIVLILFAGVMRLWDLGPRMLHHDESLHAVYSYYLYIGKGYKHDPMMHGPFQFHIMALMYVLFGAVDATVRFAPALVGTILVFTPYLFRRFIGHTGAFSAAALIAFSPSLLYFSRFAREDAQMWVPLALTVYGVFSYLADRRPLYLYVTAAGLSWQFATKESTYFNVLIFASFLLVVSLRERARSWLTLLHPPAQLTPAGELLWTMGTLFLPLGAAVIGPIALVLTRRTVDYFTYGVVFVALAVVSVGLGLRWRRREWLIAAAVFWGIFVVLFTTFFSNPVGFATGAVGGLKYWTEQQNVARGNQPWYYYLLLLPLYDFVAVIFGLAGVVYWLKRRDNTFALFLVWWFLSSLAMYTWASEKMPWLVSHIAEPLVILAGMTLGRLFESINWRAMYERGAAQAGLAMALAVVAAGALLGTRMPPLTGVWTLDQQQAVFSWVVLLIVFTALVAVIVFYGQQLGLKSVGKLASVVLLAILMPLSIRTAWQAAYYHGDIPVEMIVYTQTSPDVGQVMSEVERLTFRTGAVKDTFPVVYDSGVSWPFEWYLRDYKKKVFLGSSTNVPADAPIVIVGYDNQGETRFKQVLGNKYVMQRYRLRWWFPEDYRSFTFDKILKDMSAPEVRGRLWRYILYREPWNQLGSTDFLMFVRRDLAAGAWTAPSAASQTADDALYEARTRTVPAAQTIGPTDGDGKLNLPKGIALGPSGDLFVLDSSNYRVVRYDARGQFVLAWGSKGNGDGQFSGEFGGPWGIAVDKEGLVYVADTWNHRVQKFSSGGEFLQKFGSPNGQPGSQPGEFFGPRGVAVTPDGSVYVTDTGNHRVAKFGADGRFIAQFGGRGAGEGVFSEPVGITVDPGGNIYVADAWNNRVQKFNNQHRYVAQWPVLGWESQSVINKPYLALDAEGNAYVTDPENHRVLKFGPTGQILAVWGKFGKDASSLQLPTGIALDAAGNVFVVDSQNNRVQRFAPVR
ncbi:MAG: TIGR03663 family protein [Chloroflexi bacterium]|nr:TIGR03663 family protein [Chloroflexota bacterium]